MTRASFRAYLFAFAVGLRGMPLAAEPDLIPSFSESVALGSNAAGDLLRDSEPAIGAGRSNHFIAVWETRGPIAAGLGRDRDLLFSLSTDAGDLWTPPAPVNSNAGGDTAFDANPSVAGDDAGNWAIAWTSTTTDTLVGDTGPDTDILFTHSTDGGANWTVPGPLGAAMLADSGDDFAPKLRAPAGEGGPWIIVWESRDPIGGTIGTDPDILVSRSMDSGATWTAPSALDPDAGSESRTDQAPDVAEGEGGVWLACWHSSDTPGSPDDWLPELRLARSADGGETWAILDDMPPAGMLGLDERPVDWEPQLIFAGGGEWHLVWHRQIFTVFSSSGAGTFGPREVYFSRSTDDGLTWSPSAPIDLGALPSPVEGYGIRLASDRLGTTLAVWGADARDGSGATDADLYLTAWGPSAAAWELPIRLNATMESDGATDAAPALANDGNGFWVAAWEGYGRPEDVGAEGDIFTARLFLRAPRSNAPAWWMFYE